MLKGAALPKVETTDTARARLAGWFGADVEWVFQLTDRDMSTRWRS